MIKTSALSSILKISMSVSDNMFVTICYLALALYHVLHGNLAHRCNEFHDCQMHVT